jgi:RNA polymerase sigma-70 factor (ECF subfamily)
MATVDEEEGGVENVASEDNPEKTWLLKCRQKIILKAVDELPKEMKQAIVLVEFQGLSYDYAAQKLKINIGTLKSRLHNAKAKLHDKLAYLEL